MTILNISQLDDTMLLQTFSDLKLTFQSETDISAKNLLNEQLGNLMSEITKRGLSVI
jgi:hypothetical protein